MKLFRQQFRRSFEVHFCTAVQYLCAVSFDQLSAGDFHLRPGSLGQFRTAELVKFCHAPQEAVPGEDAGGGDGDIAFSPDVLIERDFASPFHKGVADEVFTAEFIGDHGGALRVGFEEIFYHSGMSPGEEAVEVTDAGVEGVVSFRHYGDHGVSAEGDFADIFGEFDDFG